MDRRSFFKFGRTAFFPSSEWEAFCHRVQRTIRGEFHAWRLPDQPIGVASIKLERLEDLPFLYTLCQKYHIAMALEGFTSPACLQTRSTIIIGYADTLNAMEAVGEQSCLVQVGVKVGQLLEKGYEQFRRVPPSLTVAQWFSSPKYHDVRPCHGFLSGVERINVLFSDGSQAVLGGFGIEDKGALSVPLLNRTIPQLFQWLQKHQALLERTYWEGEYRLDSLQKKWVDINLARIFLGQKSRLVWVQQCLIRKIPEDVLLLPHEVEFPTPSESERLIWQDINNALKALFDEQGCFLFDDEIQEQV